MPTDSVLKSPPWACPTHRTILTVSGKDLHCDYGHVFASVHDIPRFVDGPTYTDAFGAQWLRYRTTQLDSRSGLPMSADRAKRCLGEALWAELNFKQVLECGCGAGRFMEVLVEGGACVTSIDMSRAVDANVENVPLGPRHRVAQANILELPFAAHQFEIAFCLGVIQHTPNRMKQLLPSSSKCDLADGW